jgi:CubicO group peptidase (beta-lactamase class C family)
MASQFETEIARLMTQFNTPGVAVDMVARGKRHSAHMGRLTAGGSHQVTKKSRFSTACLIKVLVSIELLALAEKGEISLDDCIADHLPETANGPKAKGKILKIRHLLSHTGGYRSTTVERLIPLARASWQNCVDLLQETEQLFEPGSVFDDDHLGHILLGEIVARLRGKPVIDAVCEDVLAPLGIKPGNRNLDAADPDIYAARHKWLREDKKWAPEPDVYPEPDSSFGTVSPLSLDSGDLARLGEALLDATPASENSVISPFVKKMLFSEAVNVPREISPTRVTRWTVKAFGMGLATFQDGHAGFLTTGRGQNSCLIFDRKRQCMVALAMNTNNVLEREALLNTLFLKFAGDTSITPEPKTLDIDFDDFIKPFTTRDIGGVYVGFTPEPIEIYASPRAFVLRINKEDRYRFEASPENRLVMHAKMPMPVGLFQDPVSLRPCLTMGMHSFKKVN